MAKSKLLRLAYTKGLAGPAYIVVSKYLGKDEGEPCLSHACAGTAELRDAVERIKGELDGILREGEKHFSGPRSLFVKRERT